MTKVEIRLMGYRCERCSHEWVPRADTNDPKVCPKCKSPYWNVPPKTDHPYEAFRDAVRQTLLAAGGAATWTDIRSRAALRQKFPNNKWVRRMEEDVGLVREKMKNGNIMWSLREV